MTDPTESPESLVLAEIEARHYAVDEVCFEGTFTSCPHCGIAWPCDTAVALAAYDDRARAFAELAEKTRTDFAKMSPRAPWREEAMRLRQSGLTLAAVGAVVGVSKERVSQVLGRPGWLPRAPRPVSPERLAHAALPCRFSGCSEPIGSTSLSRRFCSTHIGCRGGYGTWSPERRTKHRALVARWKLEHPERWKEINLKAGRAYRARQRAKAV